MRSGNIAATFPETLPAACNPCQLPIARAAGVEAARTPPGPRCGTARRPDLPVLPEPCKWIFDDAIAGLGALGADQSELSLPHYHEVRVAAQALVVSQSLAHHLRNLQTRWRDFLPDTRTFLAWGSFVSDPDYVHAERVRRLGQRTLAHVFEQVDVLVSPTADGPAPTFDAITQDGPAALGTLMHTPYWNAVGDPALAVPMGTDPAGLPVSLHIAGRPFDDATVLRVDTPTKQRPPGTRRLR